MQNDIQTQSPYVGPRPFERSHQNIFFGRSREIGDLLSLVAANRITVIYAQSGVGKTSLLNAGLIPLLEQEDFEVLPQARVRGLIPESISYASVDNPYVFNTLISWAPEDTDPATLKNLTISDFLHERQHLTDDTGFQLARVSIFDQFEELFNFYPDRWQQRRSFFEQMRDALIQDDLLHIVLVIREDYIAQLDPYAGIFFNNLRTRYRVERMSPESALIAVIDPLQHFPQVFAPGTAERLVEELTKLRVETGDGKVEIIQGGFVEPVQLQVVCQNLWRNLPSDVQIIDNQHLKSFGDVDQALFDFYELCIQSAGNNTNVDENKLRMWFDDVLITPAGTRGMVYQGSQNTGGIANDTVHLLEDLHIVRAELRAGGRWYELNHDRFIEPIQKSNEAWGIARETREQQEREQILRRRLRNQILVIGAMGIFLGIMVGLLLFAIREGNRANVERANAETQSDIAATQASRAETAELDALNLAATREVQTQLLATEVARAETAEGVALMEADNAELQSRLAQSVALASQGLLELNGLVRERALIFPLEALATLPYTTQAERALGAAVQNNRILLTVRGFASIFVTSASWLSEDSRILINGFYGDTRIWDLETGILTRSFGGERFGGGIYSRDFILSPNGVWGISLDSNRNATLWNIVAGKEQISFPGVDSAAWRSNIQLVIANNNGSINFYDLTNDENQQILLAGDFKTVLLSHNGDRVLTLSNDGGLETWDAQTGEKISTLLGNYEEIVASDWSTDQRRVAAVIGNEVLVWDVLTGSEISTLSPNVNLESVEITDLDWSPNNKWIAASVGDKNNYVELFRDSINNGTVENVEYPVIIWNLETGEDLLHLSAHQTSVYSVRWSSNSQYVLSAGTDGTARVWNLSDLDELVKPSITSQDRINDVAWSPDNSKVALANDDSSVAIWDYQSRKLIATINTHSEANNVSWSPDGLQFATAGEDGLIRIWDSVTADQLQSFQTELTNDSAKLVNWSPNGEYVLATYRNGLRIIWDIVTGEKVISFQTACFTGTDWAPSALRIVTCADNRQAQIWDSTTGEKLLSLSGHLNSLLDVNWSPNGDYILTTSTDETARIWDADTGELLQTLIGHTGAVLHADWSPNSTRVATIGTDKTVREWDVESGAELLILSNLNYSFPGGINWSPSGMWIAIADDEIIKFWQVWQTSQSLLEYAKECCTTRELTLEERQLFNLPARPSTYLQAGLAHRRMRNYQLAIDNFSLAVDLDPEYVEAYINRAEVYDLLRDYDAALTDVEKVLGLNPNEARAYNVRSNANFWEGDYEQALTNIQRAVGLDPENYTFLANLGKIYGEREKYEQAISSLNRAIELNDSYSWAYNELGKVYYELGNYESALTNYKKAIEVDGDFVDSYTNIAYSFYYTGYFDQAIEYFSQALVITPSDDAIYRGRGLAFHMLGENIKALADLQTSIDLEPDNDLAYYWHGLVNLAMGNYTAASEDLIQSAELDGTSVGGAYTALWLGVISQLTREDENAKQEFMIAREVAEKLEDDDFSRLMSLLELVEGQPDIARDYYQNLLDYQPLPHQLFSPRLYLQLLVILFPENESFLITREWFDIELVKIYDELGVTFPAVLVPGFSPPNENAQSAYVQGNYSLAILYITNDIEDNPSADNYNWRGWINYLDGNLTEAVADHTFSINIDSARAIYYIDRSIAYFELGLLDLAIEDYETAINTNPSYEFILGQEPRDNSTLIGTYTRAIDIYPENTIARTFRGNAHAILGDYENAVMDLEQAILVTPLFVPAYKVLGDVYYQLERYDKALDIYQQYLEIAGDNADEDVLGRLNELKTEN